MVFKTMMTGKAEIGQERKIDCTNVYGVSFSMTEFAGVTHYGSHCASVGGIAVL
jgi:hypothetical protein